MLSDSDDAFESELVIVCSMLNAKPCTPLYLRDRPERGVGASAGDWKETCPPAAELLLWSLLLLLPV